ncbi:MAG: response regulator [Desulfomicrobium sp.]|jgi:DNA-binding response OmpR family regulator|nr:response regulator [Desulfomicrobium sp.]NLV96668.1 response regulator [Desulfovibrionales bacterium]
MNKLRVLLIDDEEAFVTTLQERLELRDIEARVALDGQQGLHTLTEYSPHVVVLDLRMPGLSGIEVLKQIRHQWPQLPVIMLSGHGSKQDAQTCLDLGAVQYHKKPLDIEELVHSLMHATSKGW